MEDPDRRDDLEAAALYDLIENHVAAQFYDRDEQGLPQRWIAMVAHTLQTLGPKVLATRMVRDYVMRLYAPAAHASRARAADGFAQARELTSYRLAARSAFGQVHVDHVDSEGVSDAPQVGDRIRVKADVSLGALAPEDVDVQVVHGRASEADELSDVESVSLTHAEAYDGSRHRFEGEVTLPRTGAFGYTVRVLPRHAGLASPAELGLVVNA